MKLTGLPSLLAGESGAQPPGPGSELDRGHNLIRSDIYNRLSLAVKLTVI